MFQQPTSLYTPSPRLVHVGALIFSLTSWDSCRNLIALQAVSYRETTDGCLRIQQGSLFSSDSICPTRTSKERPAMLFDWYLLCLNMNSIVFKHEKHKPCSEGPAQSCERYENSVTGKGVFVAFLIFSCCLAVALKRCDFVFAGANLLLPPVRLYGPRVHAQNPKGNRWNSQKLLWSTCAVATLHFASCSACLAALVGLQLQLFAPELCALGYASLSRFEEKHNSCSMKQN